MASNLDQKNDIAILLVGHGSRLPYSKEVIMKLAEMYKERTDHLVDVAFMELAKPSIPETVNKLAKKGVRKIIVIPVFLAHGVHTKHDIPHILGLKDDHEHSHGHQHEHETVDFDGEIIYTEPLGADPRIVEIIEERVEDAIKQQNS